VRKLVDRFNQNKGQPLPADDPVWSRVSARDRSIYEQLQSVQSDELRERFRALLARHRQEFEAMSPDSVLPNLKTRIYVLHGVADPVFPPGEAEWMRKELEHNPHAHLLITPWISHVFVGAPASKLEHWRTMQFCARMLAEAAHREVLTN
jgi:pimeloyl-ACP methyl ester carboxylesterase